MGVTFVHGGIRGEVSALPDTILGFVPDGGVNGIAFIDFAYVTDSSGDSTLSVDGLHIGTCHSEAQTRLSFMADGSGNHGCHDIVGDAFILRAPGHVGRTRWSGGYKARFISFTPAALERLTEAPMSRLNRNSVVCDLAERMSVFHLLAALSQGQPEQAPVDPLLVESIAVSILRASGLLACPEMRWSPSLTTEQARNLRDFVTDALAEPVSLQSMAERVGLSESYFVRAFKGSFGVTPYRYVLQERVAHAQMLIRSGSMSLADVAARSGFPDARRMGRTFRQITGRSPTGGTRRRQPD